MNDGTKIKAELVGIDKKTDLAVLKVKPVKPLKAVKFGDSDKLRLGEWVIAIGNPFSLGGTVTAGIVSARNRDISRGPTTTTSRPTPRSTAAIPAGRCSTSKARLSASTRRSSRRPAARSASASPCRRRRRRASSISCSNSANCAAAGSACASSRSPTRSPKASASGPPRGALVAGVDDKGPAKPAGIEPGDVIVKFDGKDVKDPKDLPRVVADTPVGKEVDVVVVRKGKEETRKVTLGRLEDSEKVQQAAAKTKEDPAEKAGDAKGARPRSRRR